MGWRWCSSGDRPAAAVARDLGVGEGTLGNWVRQARIDRGDRCGLTTSERTELVELRRENAKLPVVRELLKGATAFAVLELGHRPANAGLLPSAVGFGNLINVPGRRCQVAGVLRVAQTR